MHKRPWARAGALLLLWIVLAVVPTACLNRSDEATPTPTKTPRRAATSESSGQTPATADQVIIPDLPTNTPLPSPSPTPLPPTPTPLPTTTPVPTSAPSPTHPPATKAPAATQAPVATQAPPPPTQPPAPATDFVISELRVMGQGENNGGIESGGLHNIYVTVLDAAGSPIDGALIANTAPYPMSKVVTGDKGSGKAEILMMKEEFRIKVESVNGQPVTSEVSHNLSLISPVPADIAGKLGDACPSADNCPLPPYKHFSYAITFRRTH
jgi:hypothetical protein